MRARAVHGLWALLALLWSTAVMAGPVEDFHAHYAALLEAYWRPAAQIHGIRTTGLDYRQMAHDAAQPGARFAAARAALAQVDAQTLGDGPAAKAFWLNAYNFGTLQLIVAHYPVDSIRSRKISLFRQPWSKPAVQVGARSYTLQEIEKDILLRRFGDRRIVFAMHCAALSCPDRPQEAFDAEQVERQLDALIRGSFANPTKGLRLDTNHHTLTVAWILKKHAALFAADGVLGFVLRYVDGDLRRWLEDNPVELRYFEHDWALDERAQLP